MPAEESTEIAVESSACGNCGVPLRPEQCIVDFDGRTFCQACFDDQESLIELQLDREAGGAEPEFDYQCSVCGNRFPVERVYLSDGVITCVACWEKSHGSQPAAEVGAATDEPSIRPRRRDPAPSVSSPRPRPPPRAPLLARVTCPHCWEKFAPQDILWVARHAQLIGDPVVGPEASLRFLPSQFSAEGLAIDARGMLCQSLACPNCHLIIPRPLIESEPLFASIVGVGSSGKSCFLTAMSWELRRVLPLHFGVSFNDADPSFNRTLNQQEETLFLPGDPERPAKIDKTESCGPQCDQIHVGQQTVSLPKPLLFTMRPSGKHPNADYAAHLSRVVCLYDNAGEDFNPGEDGGIFSMTQHLGASRVVMFLYDPTQDPRFRARLRALNSNVEKKSPSDRGMGGPPVPHAIHDPQIDESWPTRRQETILIETAARVRQFAGLPTNQPIKRPLLVILPKADIWGGLVNLDLTSEPIVPACVANGALAGVDLDRIEGVSNILRKMLLETAPEFVAAADAFSNNVVYIPMSALGNSPESIGGREGLWIRPVNIKPRWVTVPFLYMFARWTHDVIARVRWEKAK